MLLRIDPQTLSVFVSFEDVTSEPEVLVIDDDQNLVNLMVLGLQEQGFRASGSITSVDGLMHVSDLQPTCIVVDLKMPGVEGLDLVQALCGIQRHAVIVLSAFVDVADAVAMMRVGVFDVLQKPVSAEALSLVVKRARLTLTPLQPSHDLTFTRRERQVGELLVKGMTAKQIGLELDLSPRTIEFFRANLMRKTLSPNLAALASALTRIGFS